MKLETKNKTKYVFKSEFNQFREKITSRIDNLETRMDTRIDNLEVNISKILTILENK